jgi:hypothetical protein
VVTNISEEHTPFRDHENYGSRFLLQAVTFQRAVTFIATDILSLISFFDALSS